MRVELNIKLPKISGIKNIKPVSLPKTLSFGSDEFIKSDSGSKDNLEKMMLELGYNQDVAREFAKKGKKACDRVEELTIAGFGISDINTLIGLDDLMFDATASILKGGLKTNTAPASYADKSEQDKKEFGVDDIIPREDEEWGDYKALLNEGIAPQVFSKISATKARDLLNANMLSYQINNLLSDYDDFDEQTADRLLNVLKK